MPFGFNLSQVFQMLMAKTMWDVRLGNTTFGGGFAGSNFMNSCWGNGFQTQMPWGDSFNAGASAGGGSSLTAEERAENRMSQNKFNTLKGVIDDYIKTLKENSEERILLEEKLKDCSSYSAEHYEELKDLYNEYKTKIQAKLKSGTVVSESSQKAAKDVSKALNSTNPNLKTVLKLDSSKQTTAELAEGIDAVGLLNQVQTTNKKSYSTLYASAKATNKAELDKLTKALYNNLSESASKLKKETDLSDETKKVLTDLSGISANDATVENVDQLYYWVRKAKAEINSSRYADLQEDFPEDTLFGNSNSVEEVKKTLKTEGLDSAKIEKATVKPDCALDAMNDLGDKVTPLSTELFNKVKQYLPDEVEQAWFDTNSRNSYQTIRFIDENGDLKCLYNIAVVKGKIQKINNKEVKVGEGLSPEKIEAISNKLDEIKNSGAFSELKSYNGERVFEEKRLTGGRSYKRLFRVDSNGDLRVWENTQYYESDKKYHKIDKSKKTPLGDVVAVDDIKNAEGTKFAALGVDEAKKTKQFKLNS